LENYDLGFSWEEMLRFQPVQFKSGGTFKLCFCDSERLGGGACNAVTDFAIQVGTIHSSGVSCLVSQPRLQRVSCAEQHHGGMRCYGSVDAPNPVPPVLEVTAPPAANPDLDLHTFCLMMPQEEARMDSRCDENREFYPDDEAV